LDLLKKDVKLFSKITKSEDSSHYKKENFFIKMRSNLYSIDEPLSPKGLDLSIGASPGSPLGSKIHGAPPFFLLFRGCIWVGGALKQRKSKQRKQRFWKQKRQKYSQKRRKYRKRRRFVMGKIRILSKQIKRVKNQIELQNWWWKHFIPTIQASNEALWQLEKDQLIQQKLSELSALEIIERDRFLQSNDQNLQIGNKDFKPLGLPETILGSLRVLNPLWRDLEPQGTLKKGGIGTKFDTGLSTDTAFLSKKSLQGGGGAPPPKPPGQISNPDGGEQSSSHTFLNRAGFEGGLGRSESAETTLENLGDQALLMERRQSFGGHQQESVKKPIFKRLPPNFQTINKLYENLFIPIPPRSESAEGDPPLRVAPSPPFALPEGEGWAADLPKGFRGPGPHVVAKDFQDFMVPNTILPFYAGWDESLRQFVITNRILSRKDAGFQMKLLDTTTSIPALSLLTLNLENLSLINSKSTGGYKKDIGVGEQSSPKPQASPPQRGGGGRFEKKDKLEKDRELNFSHDFVFSQAPLRGMNAATTLYWQIPFTTYDPDQFFALGMDGFSPIGWRKFLFRHSILKTWLNPPFSPPFGGDGELRSPKPPAPKGQPQRGSGGGPEGEGWAAVLPKGFRGQGPHVAASCQGLWELCSLKPSTGGLGAGAPQSIFKRSLGDVQRTFDAKNVSRRLKKRYRRVKKHPRTPVWFPSGPLLNQVLPVHYIYVFYKRARLPRDRYLKRQLLNTKNITNSEGLNILKTSTTGLFSNERPTLLYFKYDLTLRKRLKPKRKYHLKRQFYSSNLVIPHRFKFIGSQEMSQRWRPLSSLKINKSIEELVKEQKYLRLKQRGKEDLTKGQTPNIRVKQLRRRVQRQILRSVWRYRPRAGGFVWPGDYLKLEPVNAPSPNLDSLTTFGEPSLDFKENTVDSTTNTTAINNSTNRSEEKVLNTNISTRKGLNFLNTKRKKKRVLVEWQIQPKKYLYEKHNKKVLKKKLEKTFRSYTRK
jgi:hypothetical protein